MASRVNCIVTSTFGDWQHVQLPTQGCATPSVLMNRNHRHNESRRECRSVGLRSPCPCPCRRPCPCPCPQEEVLRQGEVEFDGFCSDHALAVLQVQVCGTFMDEACRPISSAVQVNLLPAAYAWTCSSSAISNTCQSKPVYGKLGLWNCRENILV